MSFFLPATYSSYSSVELDGYALSSSEISMTGSSDGGTTLGSVGFDVGPHETKVNAAIIAAKIPLNFINYSSFSINLGPSSSILYDGLNFEKTISPSSFSYS